MPKKTSRGSTAPSLASLVASASAEAAGAEELAGRSRPGGGEGPPSTVPLRKIRVREGHNPRKVFDEQALRELAETVAAGGIVQPIVVQPDPEAGDFWILQGERRYRSLRHLLKEGRIEEDYPVPVYVREGLDEEAALTSALVENLQREDLSPVEEAEAFAVLRDRFGRSTAEIARTVGRTRRHVQGRLQLLSLDEEVRDAVLEGEVPGSVARVLAGAPGGLQREALERFRGAPAHLKSAEAMRRHLRARLVPFEQALFDPAHYVDTHGGPVWVTETGERDPGDRGRYFADPALFSRLQEEALEMIRGELRTRYEWVEEVQGRELPGHLEEDPQGPGAVLLLPNGLFDVRLIEGVRMAGGSRAEEVPVGRHAAGRPEAAVEEVVEPPSPARLARAARLRTRALQEAVAADPVAALRAAIVALLTGGPSVGVSFDAEALRRRPDPPPTVVRGLNALARAAGLEGPEVLLDPDREERPDEGDLYHRLLSVPRGVLVRMFAALVAATLDSGSADGEGPTLEGPALAYELAQDLEVRVTDWKPTVKYFREYSLEELRAIAERLEVELPEAVSKEEAIEVLLSSERIGEYSPPELAFRPPGGASSD